MTEKKKNKEENKDSTLNHENDIDYVANLHLCQINTTVDATSAYPTAISGNHQVANPSHTCEC